MPSKTTYRSTRGGVRQARFEEIVFAGLAPDKGLFVPETIPQLPANALKDWQKLTYSQLAVEVMSLFIPESEVPRSELQRLVEKSYNSESFRHESVAPVVKLQEQGGAPLYVLELFHGPTFAFKDIALQFLGNLFDFFLERKNKKRNESGQESETMTVVGATSGDTGSSAIYGLRSKNNIEVFILYPNGKVSEIQERQMITILDDNVHNVAVEGTFDDCQAIVKDLFSRPGFKKEYSLGAVNSINWARILAQIVYYFYAYFRVNEETGASKVSFSVPTGNFGDILAGFYAKKLGLPVDKLLVATNENDILHRFFSTGKYHLNPVTHTIAPSMDICISSNFERFLFFVSGNDSQQLKNWMDGFSDEKKLTVSGEVLKKAQSEMLSARVSQKNVQQVIKSTWDNEKYLLDPHTAIGYAAAVSHLNSHNDSSPMVVVGTAHPGKFLPTVELSLGGKRDGVNQHPLLSALATLPKKNYVLNSIEPTATMEYIIETVSKRKAASNWKCCLNNYLSEYSLIAAVSISAVGLLSAYLIRKR